MRTPGHFLLVLMSLALFSGCGGRVKFVNDHAEAKLPEQPLARTRLISESFKYGHPVGTQVVALVLSPRKSLDRVRTNLIQHLPSFMESILNSDGNYQALHWVVMRDVQNAQQEWFSPNASGLPQSRWLEESVRSVRATLSRLEIEKTAGETLPISPFENFSRIALSAGFRIPRSQGPIWINFYYLRDSNLIVDSNYEELFRSTVKQYQSSLEVSPISGFRTDIHLVSYFNSGGECDPLPSRVAHNLMNLFTGFNRDSTEICPLFSETPAPPATTLSQLGNLVHGRARRLILERIPAFGTVQVSVRGLPVPKAGIALNEGTNEIVFRENTLPFPNPGDEIQVQYEASAP